EQLAGCKRAFRRTNETKSHPTLVGAAAGCDTGSGTRAGRTNSSTIAHNHQESAITTMLMAYESKYSASAAMYNGPIALDRVIIGRTAPEIAPMFARPKYAGHMTWFKPTQPPRPMPARAPAISARSPGKSSNMGTAIPL